ncbi:hypothetical protein [Ruminococcus sp.]|uniref:hypothetical protein n=1 Tax=Ruminococcus sp. TaxID=41978 RepID=UPI0025DE7CBB|nr:hypothetical protein [Ruminococcus sp.]MBQ9541576.1 hypothetical protein [Ruminococcus sp.]
MRTKAKAALIAAAAIVGAAGGLWLTWCRGINYEKRYKDLFDKTFKGDYKITVTESGFTYNPEAPLKLPFRYKIYDVEYKDKNGKERHLKLDSRESYQHYSSIDESLIEYIKNRSKKSDYYIATAIAVNEYEIAKDDAYNNIVPKYFDAKYDPEVSSFRASSDGYSIAVLPFESNILFFSSDYSNEDKLTEFLSPENCPILSDFDFREAAKSKTFELTVQIEITDESKFDMIDEFTEKAEALCSEYASASDLGGNYHYTVRTKIGEGDEAEVINRTDVYVINGEKVDIDKNKDRASQKFRAMIVEKCGYNTEKRSKT